MSAGTLIALPACKSDRTQTRGDSTNARPARNHVIDGDEMLRAPIRFMHDRHPNVPDSGRGTELRPTIRIDRPEVLGGGHEATKSARLSIAPMLPIGAHDSRSALS